MDAFPTLVINLEGSEDRLTRITDGLAAEGIGFTRLAAIDGRGKDPSFDPRYAPMRTRLWYGLPLTGAEVACFASHLAAIERFLESDAALCLVLEDDASPRPGAGAAIAAIAAWLAEHADLSWECVHLGSLPSKSGYLTPINVFEAADPPVTLCLAHDFPLNTRALMWSRPGAENFHRRARRITATVDNVLRSMMAWHGHGLCLDPPLFAASGADSQIATRRSDLRKPAWFRHRSRARAATRRRAGAFWRARWKWRLQNG